jgi:hypothetical protein
MATKRNDPEKEKRHKLNHRAPPPPSSSFEERLMNKADKEAEREQARLWAKLERAERHIPTGNVAQRNRTLERIYADLVANSAVGFFASSERGRKLIDTRSGRDFYIWMEEQRRLDYAFFFFSSEDAFCWALDICAHARCWGSSPFRTSLGCYRLVANVRVCPGCNPDIAIIANGAQALSRPVILFVAKDDGLIEFRYDQHCRVETRQALLRSTAEMDVRQVVSGVRNMMKTLPT